MQPVLLTRGSEDRRILVARDEQSGNAQTGHQMLAIREARTTSASASARQTSSVGSIALAASRAAMGFLPR